MSYGFSARSFPSLGGQFYGELGKSWYLWQKKPSPVLFGLVRPSIKFESIGVINTVGAKLEFFPISFVAFYAGHSDSWIKTRLKAFNCDTLVQCKGRLERSYIGVKLALKYKKNFLLGGGEIQRLSFAPKNKLFPDYEYVLEGHPKGDQLQTWWAIFGHQWKDYKIGVGQVIAGMKRQKGVYNQTFAFGSKVFSEKYILSLGAGTAKSLKHKKQGLFLLKLDIIHWPSLKLF